MVSATDDVELVRAARTGDREAFAALVTRHYRTVYGLAYSTVGDWAAAEDIAQETFLAAYKNFARLRNAGVFLMWLRRIVRNLSATWIRSEVYRRKLAQHLAAADAAMSRNQEQPPDAMRREEQRLEVWNALSRLTPSIREAMVLYYMEGQSTIEAARALGVSENTVRTRLYRGRKEMRQDLEQRIEANLTRKAPREAVKRVMASVALGPAVAHVGAVGDGLGLWAHHVMHGGASALVKPAIMGGTIVSAKKASIATIIVLALCAGLYVNHAIQGRTPPADTGAPLIETKVMTEEAPTAEPETSATMGAEASPRPEPTPLPITVGTTALAEHPASEPEMEPGTISDPALYCSIAGKVADSEGNPIPGAQVMVVAMGHHDSEESRNPYLYIKKQVDRAHHFVGTTDYQGKYKISGIRFSGKTVVWASKEGYATRTARFDEETEGGGIRRSYTSTVALAPGDALENVDITLSPGVTLKGRVFAADATPVTDGVVRCMGSWADAQSSVSHDAGVAYTDARGWFALGYISKVHWCNLQVVSATHGQCTFKDIPITEEEVELRFEESAKLTGKITRGDGTPAKGYVVRLRGVAWHPEGSGKSGTFGSEHTAVVGEDGTYYFAEVDPGQDYELTVFAPDGSPASTRSDLPPIVPGETAQWDYVLREGITIRGRVLGEFSGRPVKHVKVRYLKNGMPLEEHENQWSGMDVADDGKFEFYSLSGAGEYLLYPVRGISTGDWDGALQRKYGRKVNIEEGDEIELNLDFLDTCTISIRVLDTEGKPIQGIGVEVHQNAPAGYHGHTGTGAGTDKDGRLSWSGFDPGLEAWMVTYSNDLYLDAESAHYVGEPGEVFPEEALVLYRQAGVSGRAVDQAGIPLGDTEIHIFCHYGDDCIKDTSQTTDADGFFELTWGVAAARVVLELTADKDGRTYRWVSDEMECEAGEVTDLGNIVFAPDPIPADSQPNR